VKSNAARDLEASCPQRFFLRRSLLPGKDILFRRACFCSWRTVVRFDLVNSVLDALLPGTRPSWHCLARRVSAVLRFPAVWGLN
jgi:hypothetical protein